MNKKPNFFKTEEGRLYLEEHYVKGDMSVPEIAKEKEVYPNIIYRALRQFGIKRKDRSEAQTTVFKSGRAKHPTKGKKRTYEDKHKIGESLHNSWKNLKENPEKLEKRVAKCRKAWYKVPEKTRLHWLKKSHRAIREASVKGSKFEKYLVAALLASGFKVQVHHELLIENSKMHVDFYLPEYGICVECDGISHFKPIYGPETFEKRQENDLLKNEQLLGTGYSVVRIDNQKNYKSATAMEKFALLFIPFIKIISNLPKNTLYEISVDDALNTGKLPIN